MNFALRPFAGLQAAGLCLIACSLVPAISAQTSATRAKTKAQATAMTSAAPPLTVTIPGPLRSFQRLAGISQKALPNEVLPLLARNVYLQGYHTGTPTEFLLLIDRYVNQARELQILAGAGETIRVADCNEAGTLIQILGYRLRHGCGKDIALETANAERAFLTIDSAFPLTELEEAMQKGVPFTYAYPSSHLPVMFQEGDWITLSAGQKAGYNNLLDVVVNDPQIARLYWALSRSDVQTRTYWQQSLGLRYLLTVAPMLDFYGSQISIRGGRVMVPGGTAAEAGWKTLVGASPETPVNFTTHLLTKDNGWLAAYFDVLSRVGPVEQKHLTEGPRLQRLYEDFHGAEPKGSAAVGVFRQASDLLILDSRVPWEANGELHIPGGLEVWKQVLQQKSDSRIVRDWAKRAKGWNNPDQMLEAMTAFSRVQTDIGPLQFYLTLCELDRRRAADQKLAPATVSFMATKFSLLSSWYLIFSEFPGLSDESIVRFVNVADSIDKISNKALRANVLGAFQANVGLWQILARQQQIASSNLNASWLGVMELFAKVNSATDLFDAARGSLKSILAAAGGKANGSPGEIVDLLAGPAQQTPDGQRMHDELAARMRAVLDDQRLVSIDTLFALSDGLGEMERGGAKGSDALLSLAGELREFELPRPIFTNSEKVSWAPAVYTSHHAELQVQTDLTKVIKTPGTKAQLEAARGQLAPFLRDTLVGLNYAYYEPPGAQILHINPLFVRAHDFLGVSVTGTERLWGSPVLLGAGIAAGGGAYLMGSLADLPYSLATAEEDFIVPENVQALIWKELVPDLVAGATLPRWWNVNRDELHAVALYQRAGEELLKASSKDDQMRGRVMAILATALPPQRLEEVEGAMPNAEALNALMPRLLPSDTFYLEAEYRKRFPDDAASFGPAGKELDVLAKRSPAEVSAERVSRDFGVPHPTLAHTNALELLNTQPFPFSGGYTSRSFGESLESSNLYWGRLADEMGYSPVMMHRLVPELTRYMIGKIFATDLEDWPAMLRAMRETGDDLRLGRIGSLRMPGNPPPVEQAVSNVHVN